MNRKQFFSLSSGLFGAAVASAAGPADLFLKPVGKTAATPSLPSFAKLRQLASRIPGELPLQINVTKVADSIRPASVVVEGEDPARKMTLARTVYQVLYEEGTVMLDAGMDLATHRTFGKTKEPFYAENYEDVQEALRRARLIVFTHYHADHIAGVIRSPYFADLAGKVWLTADTLALLVDHPHKETVKIAVEKTADFVVCDFEDCYPLAPGLVIFKTPGHTPDSKMLFIQLKNGKEYIHSVDSGWSMENITEEKMKAASWVNENKEQLRAQYQWLNKLIAENPELIVLCTHDNEQFEAFRESGILGSSLAIS